MHTAHHTQGGSEFICHLPDEMATEKMGGKLAACLRPGMVVTLSGDLGAGKTSLVRATLRALGYLGKVKSPTYTLVELYVVSSLNLYHFDFYRFNDPEEWEEAGFREYFNPLSVCLVEWPEKAGTLLPRPDVAIWLEIEGTGRRVRASAATDWGRACLEALSREG